MRKNLGNNVFLTGGVFKVIGDTLSAFSRGGFLAFIAFSKVFLPSSNLAAYLFQLFHLT